LHLELYLTPDPSPAWVAIAGQILLAGEGNSKKRGLRPLSIFLPQAINVIYIYTAHMVYSF
jgi:hypothetical protein